MCGRDSAGEPQPPHGGGSAASEAPGPEGEMDVDDLIAWLESRHLRGHEREAYLQMRKACEEFGRDCSRAMDRARDEIGRVNMNIEHGGSVSPEFRAHIVDMIRAGLEDGLALAILDRAYLQNGLHGEFFGVCEDILKFDGHARDVMMGSVLVEFSIHQLVHRLATGQGDPQKHGELAGRCISLLEKRAGMLGIDISAHKGESNPLYRADLIAMDVYARRHFEHPDKIARILQEYPRLCEFLCLTPDKISSLVRKRKDLAYHASIAVHVKESTPSHERPRPGPLDMLESLLLAMESHGLNARDCVYGSWRSGICDMKLVQCHLEMRLYVHFLPVDRDIELEPPIDDGKLADLKVRGLYVEAFAPHEYTSTAFGHMRLMDAPAGLIQKICEKSQIDSFGRRPSIIVLEDPHNYVNDTAFHEMLARKIRPHAQLGGVLIARDVGTHYRCKLVKNPGAVSGITPEMERMVTQALGTPYCQ